MDNAFAFTNKNAICTESSYIYTGTKGTYSSSSCTVGLALGSVTGFKDVTVNSVEALMDALVQQPVSIAIEADSVFFQLYSGGPWSPCAGYGTDGSSDYWKVKNSRGSSWGESGYLSWERSKGGADECGILSGPPSYPVVSSSFAGLDDEGCGDSREESGTAGLLVDIHSHGRSEGYLGLEHGQSRISERTAVRGLRHGIWPIRTTTNCWQVQSFVLPTFWAYAFNCDTEVDQSLWPSGEVDVVSFKRQFESRNYRPKESDVDLDAWASLAKLVFPLGQRRLVCS